ncbi:MAG TPA: RecQ family ATP-dependent DNA helicase [Porphyromonadaceae bacterium]|nr:RecQ family ATP-dependent DNA helicase [Porphyromonadaceae bacterium]
MLQTPDIGLLQKYWGYSSFRPLQEEIISSVLSGKDTLALMPTGGGKSITFQLPTLMMEGMCLVISPLIALMKDQVENLRRRYIKATTIHQGMSLEEIHNAIDNCLYGNYKFLYVSPERLNSELFLSNLSRLNLCLIAVDEAHCISQWGYDFRPSYLNISSIRPLFKNIPILALTATATPNVVEDIQEKLHFREKNVLRKSFFRENISYVVREVNEKETELLHILSKVQGSSIVYLRSREKTKEICNLLQQNGLSATYYHAGLSKTSRDERQKLWTEGKCKVIVATNAFGMGIDKADVRLVVHLDLPDSLEEYFQESGRAGRDGKKSYAVFLHKEIDNRLIPKRISEHFPPKEFIKEVYEKLGNYFQIAQESGAGKTFEFIIEDFSKVYHFSAKKVYHSLKILEQSGYISYNEDGNNASRIKFTIERDELYKLHQLSHACELIIHCLLRNYSGLFSEYVFVNEELLSLRTKLSREEQYESLKHLSHLKIISYIPQRKNPSIMYLRQREDSQRISIPISVYEDRLKNYKEKIESVRDYLENTKVCRSIMLVSYFSQEEEKRECGICDICLQKKNMISLTGDHIVSIRRLLCIEMENTLYSVAELIEHIPFPKEEIIEVLYSLLEEGIIQKIGEDIPPRFTLKPKKKEKE